MDKSEFTVNVDCSECPEDLGPPPDDILGIPPPPLPYFLRLNSNNESAQCYNQCAWAPNFSGVEYIELSHHGSAHSDTWFYIIGALCAGIMILAGLFTVLLLKFRAKIVNKSSIQAASTIVKSKNCESVLYPYPSDPTPDGRVLWATITARGTTHHYTTTGSHSQAKTSHRSPSKTSLSPPDPPITFDNTGFDSDSQTPLMESYQMNDFVENDGTSDSSTLKQRLHVSSPTRIEHPNLPPLNLHPHRTIRRTTLQNQGPDIPSSPPI